MKKKEKKLFEFFSLFITRTNVVVFVLGLSFSVLGLGGHLKIFFRQQKQQQDLLQGNMTDFIILFNSINSYYYFLKIHLQAADFASTVDVQHGPGRPDRLEQVRTRTRFKITFLVVAGKKF